MVVRELLTGVKDLILLKVDIEFARRESEIVIFLVDGLLRQAKKRKKTPAISKLPFYWL